MLEQRQKKEYLLIKQQVIRKEREDSLIQLKNHIIRRCWRVHMCAEIILSKVLVKVCRDAKKIEIKIRNRLRRTVAVACVVRSSRKFLLRFGDPRKRVKPPNQLRSSRNEPGATAESSRASGRQPPKEPLGDRVLPQMSGVLR